MKNLDLVAIGARLKEIRGDLTQAAFAKAVGFERQSIGRYESGDRAPDAALLLALLTQFKIDLAWLLTGQGDAPNQGLSPDEQELLTMFRAASLSGKYAAVGALKGTADAEKPKSRSKTSIHIAGNVGQSIESITGKNTNVIYNEKDTDMKKKK